MGQNDLSLISESKITSDTVMINQCDENKILSEKVGSAQVRMICTTERGLTKSRNMAIRESDADICLLCDDDEIFESGYEQGIINAYENIPDADVIAVRMKNVPCAFGDEAKRLSGKDLFKIASWQISFKRKSIISAGVFFDELLGAGTSNGAEEELKFLTDCQKAGLKIYYAPVTVASVKQEKSTWFSGFDEKFFENRGATTRYILGFFKSSAYAVYYVLKKKDMYKDDISSVGAFKAIFRGIFKNKITKQKKELQK